MSAWCGMFLCDNSLWMLGVDIHLDPNTVKMMWATKALVYIPNVH